MEQILEIIEFETSLKPYEIPESHKSSIDRGLAQIEAGQIFTNEEVKQKVNQWAGK